MFGRRIKLFEMFGFTVRVDASWLIIAVLVTWSLSKGLFPHLLVGLSTATYWWMGITGALGLFGSIIIHELSHSLVARRYGLPIRGITLWIFGGVAEMGSEPPSPRAEFMMAIAGPITSIALGVVFFGLHGLSKASGWPPPITGVLEYLGSINWLLAAFNLLPGFPLDGGRVLRSVLWHFKNNLRWATRIASQVGSGFGTALVIIGVSLMVWTRSAVGLWPALIGMFLRFAARSSYQQLLVRQALEGEKVRHFMNPEPIAVPPDIPVAELVEDYVYRYHFKMFPVLEADGTLVGCVTTQQTREVPRDQWGKRTVRELTEQCSQENSIHPQDDAMRVLSKMNRTQTSRLMVVEGNHLVGIITLKDMLRFLSLKMELEGGENSHVPSFSEPPDS